MHGCLGCRAMVVKPTFCIIMSQELTLQQAQSEVDLWIKTIGVRYFNELTNTAILMEEVGELARIMARTYGEQSSKSTDKPSNLSDEMAA